MNGADRADLPKSPPDFRILRGKTNEFMRIYEATEPSDLLAEAFARLLPQLSERMTAPDREAVARIVASPATRQLVAAAEDGRIVGLLSVALYDVPSGRKAWIEDVVVDAATRGRGIGEALVISDNTAKAHIRSIYAKTGVHTRQEFIDATEHVMR